MKKLLFIFGTRPEAIKMAPLVKEFLRHPGEFEVRVCVTAQHRKMLDQVLSFFAIKPDFDLDLMRPDQSLFDVTAYGLRAIEEVISGYKPDLIFVQGDTTTAFIGALAGFYKKVKIAHLEAGLRSMDKYSPYPEEMNRVLVGKLSDFHFAPTRRAAENLAGEAIRDNVWVVGNTVLDALFLVLDMIGQNGEEVYYRYFDFVDFSKRIILVTGHRRESFGKPFEDICSALREIADGFDDVEIVYPIHLNPHVQKQINSLLKDHRRIHLIKPLDYPHLIWIMNKSYMVLTDSGGIQEEAPSLGKPVLVMRDVTERTEGIEAGTSRRVGTSRASIVGEAKKLLTDTGEYQKIAKAVNPYGDGRSSERILQILHNELT
jgi:UDP-N-acetylglucosamine 2-epimerase (non-hydrolysing)